MGGARDNCVNVNLAPIWYTPIPAWFSALTATASIDALYLVFRRWEIAG
jgi:hypothetical protein